MTAFRVIPPSPICAICDKLMPHGCKHCYGMRHRLRVHPLHGFRVDDLDIGDLLIREPNGTWSLEWLPEVVAHWGWAA